MASADSIVIVGAARTPLGSFQGKLKSVPRPNLARSHPRRARAVRTQGQVSRRSLDGLRPSRRFETGARGRPHSGRSPNSPSAHCEQGLRVGMKAAMLDTMRSSPVRPRSSSPAHGEHDQRALSPSKARGGYRMGHGQVLDHIFLDGLENAYDGALMGRFAEDTAEKYQFTRAVQDEFRSPLSARQEGRRRRHLRARDRRRENERRNGRSDEQPTRADPAKIPQLKPPSATAAPSPRPIEFDFRWRRALILMSEGEANRNTLRPLARIVGHATTRRNRVVHTAPVGAIEKLLERSAGAR